MANTEETFLLLIGTRCREGLLFRQLAGEEQGIGAAFAISGPSQRTSGTLSERLGRAWLPEGTTSFRTNVGGPLASLFLIPWEK